MATSGNPKERIREATEGVITLSNMLLRLGHDLRNLLSEEGLWPDPPEPDGPPKGRGPTGD